MTALPARRILVPVDLSPIGAQAWRWARTLAEGGARLEALYVHETPMTPILGLPAVTFSTGFSLLACIWKIFPMRSLRSLRSLASKTLMAFHSSRAVFFLSHDSLPGQLRGVTKTNVLFARSVGSTELNRAA